jgi:hypothetical protein
MQQAPLPPPPAGLRHWIMFLFGVIILAGESFKVFGINVSGLILLVILWQIRGHARRAAVRYLWLVVPLVVFSAIGVFRYRIGDVIEDTVPLITFFVVAAAIGLLPPEERLSICKFVVVLSAFAVLKILAINYLNITPEWGGTGFWQGTKEPMDGVNRIVLKGADVFIGTSAVLLLMSMTLKKGLPRFFRPRDNLLLLTALTISVVFSLTRGTMVAIATTFLFWTFAGLRSGALKSAGRFVVALVVCGVVIAGPLAQGASAYYDRFIDTVGMGQHAAEDDVAFAYRLVETVNALDAARQTHFLGAGFGVSFFTPLSGSEKSDGRSLFVHSLPTWLILKIGVGGFLLIYGALLWQIRIPLRKLFLRTITAAEIPFAIAAIGGLSYLMANDLINNKFSTLSGGAAYALYFVMAESCRVTQRETNEEPIAVASDRR